MKWPRHKRRRRGTDTPRRILLRQIFWGVLLVVLVSGLGYGVWYVTHLPSLNLNEVIVKGGETISHDEIRSLAEEELIGDYFHLIPKRFVLTYPQSLITESVLKQDRVEKATVWRDGQMLIVDFSEYQPFALWCGAEEGECFFLDDQGFAFSKSPRLAGSAFIRYNETGGRSLEVRTQAFDVDLMRDSTLLIKRVRDQFGFNITRVEKTGVEEITYHIAGGGTIKVSMRMGIEETLGNLATILSSQEFLHLTPGNFQYIDLRYGNKVFVNENLSLNDEATTITSTSSADMVEDRPQ